MKFCRRVYSLVRAWSKDNPADALATTGFAALTLGVAMLSVPWAFIIGGGLILACCIAAYVLPTLGKGE